MPNYVCPFNLEISTERMIFQFIGFEKFRDNSYGFVRFCVSLTSKHHNLYNYFVFLVNLRAVSANILYLQAELNCKIPTIRVIG